MLSNFCEDQTLSDKILEFHEKTLETFEIPKWMRAKCPFCQKELPLRSIRSVSFKLNARNLGDIALEVLCIYCSKMDTLYFKSEAGDITGFTDILKGIKEPQSTPFIEETMYKMGYNNIMEKMITSGELK